jgi:hypothetical protein
MTQIRDSYISLDINLGRQWGNDEVIKGDHSVNGRSSDIGQMLASYAGDHPQLEKIIIYAFFWGRYVSGEMSEGEVKSALEEYVDTLDVFEDI